MILVDANILLYAYNPSPAQHEAARNWLEQVFYGPEDLGFSWQTVLAFLRISTSSRAFPQAYSVQEAQEIVSGWLEHPGVVVVTESERHWIVLRGLLGPSQARGPMMMDAHLAALAIEHGATLCTIDRDFSRFPGLRFRDPLRNP